MENFVPKFSTKMSTEEEGPIDREAYIAKFSRPATNGEAKCCKCDNVAFIYPGDKEHMGICIVCIRAATEKKMGKIKGVWGPY